MNVTLPEQPSWLTSLDADVEAMTPVMRQVLDAKRSHPEAIVFFRLGDFYELFFEDALEAAPLLDMVLTSRNKKDPRPIPMCGFPHHAMSSYVQRLVEQGRPVAIVEQLEDPKKVKGIVKRGVTRVITPGVVLETEALDGKRSNYLLAVTKHAEGGVEVAAAEVSTGALMTATVRHHAALAAMLVRTEPREILLPPSLRPWLEQVPGAKQALWTVRPVLSAVGAAARRAGEGLSVAYLREYLAEIRPSALGLLEAPRPVDQHAHLQLNRETVIHLELTATAHTGRRRGSLLQAVDHTQTAGGARMLRELLLAPLAQREELDARHGAVAALLQATDQLEEVQRALGHTCDLARAAGRASVGLISPRELVQVRETLLALPHLAELLTPLTSASERIAELRDGLQEGQEVGAKLAATLSGDPQNQVGEGEVIRRGVSAQLDDLHELCQDSSVWAEQFQQQLRAELDLPTLKVRYNRVGGWAMEVPRAKVDRIPPHYRRVQTLKHTERYTTAELQDFEQKLLTAQDERSALERALYEELVTWVAHRSASLRRLAAVLAELDVHGGFAEGARRWGYCRPSLLQQGAPSAISLRQSRHPVIEQLVERFVANDLQLGAPGADVLMITGPNMAGKSTLMRQVALCCVLSQAGGFVPAESATLPVLSSVMTRIGAADDISEGASTFMVEMRETAKILQTAGRHTLVLLDEIGRGTSTSDGLAIAQAVVEQLHDHANALCLFATHYHELTSMAERLERLDNVHVAVLERGDDVVFVHQLQAGATSRSHGLTVARLAGLPDNVLKRAQSLLNNRSHPTQRQPSAAPSAQLSMFTAPRPSQTLERLRTLEPDTLTPRQALELLYSLKSQAERE